MIKVPFHALMFFFLVISAMISRLKSQPYYDLKCVDDLCKLLTAYYDSVNNITQIYIPNAAISGYNVSTACIYIMEIPGRYCEIDTVFHRVNIPSSYQRFLTVRIGFDDHPNDVFEFSVYVLKLNNSLSSIESYVEPIKPLFGSIVVGKLYVEYKHRITSFDDSCMNKFTALGLMDISFRSETNHIVSNTNHSIEPGSWFIMFHPCKTPSTPTNTPRKDKNSQKQLQSSETILTALSSYSYIEYVLSRIEIYKNRRFSTSSTEPESVCYDQSCLLDSNLSKTKKLSSRIHICFWGPNTQDGQRRIWLNQIKHMNSKEFRFSYILTRNEAYKNDGYDMEDILSSYNNVEVFPSPFNINGGLSIPNSHLEAVGIPLNQPDKVYEYVSSRLKLADYDPRRMSPPWAQSVYYTMLNTIQPLFCDVLVYGSERERANDILITDIAKVLGYPSVSELMNLFPHPMVLPTVIVGPSAYAIEHSSVLRLIETASKLNEEIPQRVLISPGVNISPRESIESSNNKIAVNIRNTLCSPQIDLNSCIIIGFIGRLAPEKNPGLFVMTAYLVIQRYSSAKFIVIGDGILKESLIDLTQRLNIADSFMFTGWIDNHELYNYIQSIDIVINPSLRAWSETFCISNIEAMSYGIPIVTYGVGGVGEYIEISHEMYAQSFNNNSSYVLAENAVLVNDASPTAIADAVDALVRDKSLREAIGAKGQQVVWNRFSITKQMNQYAELYRKLYQMKKPPHVKVEKVHDFFTPK